MASGTNGVASEFTLTQSGLCCPMLSIRKVTLSFRQHIKISLKDLTRAHAKWGRTFRKGVFLPSQHLLSVFYNTPPSKNPSKNPCPYLNPYKVPSKNPSKKALPLKNLLRTLLRSVRLHDPLGVHPIITLRRLDSLFKDVRVFKVVVSKTSRS